MLTWRQVTEEELAGWQIQYRLFSLAHEKQAPVESQHPYILWSSEMRRRYDAEQKAKGNIHHTDIPFEVWNAGFHAWLTELVEMGKAPVYVDEPGPVMFQERTETV